MGEKKAIVFSTHILEEVDAVCSRAIIIDRGKIVANGTPAELRRKSDWAGAVTARFGNVSNGVVKQKLAQLPVAKKVVVLEEKPSTVTVRVYPKSPGAEVAWTIANLSHTEKWTLEELHTEEGRLDEVFRSITMPDTAANDKKSASSEEKTSD
jgi:ABC-2 type transport system ATP-binding protein